MQIQKKPYVVIAFFPVPCSGLCVARASKRSNSLAQLLALFELSEAATLRPLKYFTVFPLLNKIKMSICNIEM